jgi:hypothetical protein
LSAPTGVIASVLLAPLVDASRQRLDVIHRGRLACQLADGSGVVQACLTLTDAIRLPHAAVVSTLPDESSPVTIGEGTLGWDSLRHPISRWWAPPRPFLPHLRSLVDDVAVERFVASWDSRLGLGAGLTPYGDDVVCGALVTLVAAGHPLAGALVAEVKTCPLERRTTATSAGLLRFAADGYCIDELAAFLTDPSPLTARRLRTVGHSSGRGLLDGVSTVLPAACRHAKVAA